MIQSTPLGNMGYQGIDAAKTGKLVSYENFPEINKQVRKAVGGKSGRMPHFFQYTPNGRHDNDKKKKSFLKPNDSTMNRLCGMFDDIGNINLNYAGVPPFNYQMLLSEPNESVDYTAVTMFKDMCAMYNTVAMKMANESDDFNRRNAVKYDVVNDYVEHEFEKKYTSLKEVYPSIVTYLFTENELSKDSKSSHELFWMVFGEMAIDNLVKNLSDYNECQYCKMKVPSWVDKHVCSKSMRGYYECVDCGKLCERQNSRQCRCSDCQVKYRAATVACAVKRVRQRKKVAA